MFPSARTGRKLKFIELIRLLSGGGLQVCLQSDGRRADLLEKILSEGAWPPG